jgi:site-specific DNA-methyltransferase (adenine-specific)
MKDLSANTIDCFICDLPYGCLGIDRRSEKIKADKTTHTYGACSWDVKINLEEFWTQIKRLRRNKHTPVLMFCTTKFGYELIQSNPTWFRYDLVWDKQRGVSFLSANKMPMRSHEMIYVFSELGAYYNRVDIKGEFKKYITGAGVSTQYGGAIRQADKEGGDGKRCALSVIQNPTSTTRGGHPTEKPMELYTFLLQRYCPPGGTVLDPTAGSFNSCFAAFEMNLNSIGIEKDDAFYTKACERADAL